jgi:hypothetical protein
MCSGLATALQVAQRPPAIFVERMQRVRGPAASFATVTISFLC